MSWHEETARALREGGVDVVAHIPDSIVAPLIEDASADEHFETVPVAREEEAVALLSGAWLGGRRGALVCQSSGLANTFNALASLSMPWGLPFVGIVSRRGDVGEFNGAQVPAGYAMPRLLDDLGIRNRCLDGSEDVADVVGGVVRTAFHTEEPYVLLVETSLTGGK